MLTPIEGKLGETGSYKVTINENGTVMLMASVHALDLARQYAAKTNTPLDDIIVGLIGKLIKG